MKSYSPHIQCLSWKAASHVLCSVASDSLRPVDCSLPGSSVHGILWARILGWAAISSSRGSSRPRDQTHVSCTSCIGRWILYHWGHLGSPNLMASIYPLVSWEFCFIIFPLWPRTDFLPNKEKTKNTLQGSDLVIIRTAATIYQALTMFQTPY